MQIWQSWLEPSSKEDFEKQQANRIKAPEGFDSHNGSGQSGTMLTNCVSGGKWFDHTGALMLCTFLAHTNLFSTKVYLASSGLLHECLVWQSVSHPL